MLPYIFKGVVIYSAVGSVLFLLLKIFRPLTGKRFSSRWHYYVSVLLLAAMIVPVRITVPENVAISAAGTVSVSNVISGPASEENVKETAFSEASDGLDRDDSLNSPGHSLLLTNSYREKILSRISALWLFTGLGIFLFKSVTYGAFIRKIKRKSVISECELLRRKNGKCIKTLKSKKLKSPMIAGVVRPVLILPDIELSAEDMTNILSHENIHLRRRDVALKWLILLAKCVHWFNPLVYLMAKQAEIECEISCDLAATEGMSIKEKRSYASTVLHLAMRKEDRLPELVSPMSSHAESMKRRFIKIKTGEKISKKAKAFSFLLAAVLSMSVLFVSGAAVGSMENPFSDTTEAPVVTKGKNTGSKLQTASGLEKSTPPNGTEKAEIPPAEIYTLPCNGGVITDKFEKGKHEGIDISGNSGDPVYACEDGKILFAGVDRENPSDGITIVLAGSDGTVFRYLHLGGLNIFATGQLVKAGQIIGKIGSTGASTGSHIHLEVQRDGHNIDPSSVF